MNDNLLKSSQEIRDSIIGLSTSINKDFKSESIDFISLNQAPKYFLKDLLEYIEVDYRTQNLNFKDYNPRSVDGEVCITKDLDLPISGKHIILMDGVIISGITHFYLCKYLRQRSPKSISLCSVGLKLELIKKDLPNCYSLFNFKDEWVEGYGIGGSENKDKPYLVDTRG